MDTLNSKEDTFLRQVFKDLISIYNYKDSKTYQICFNSKYYEFIIDNKYPFSYPMTNIQLPDHIKDKYKNRPMIYQLLYECIKQEELNLDVVEEYTSNIEYKNIEKITEEQFQEYKISHLRIKTKKEGLSGKDMFLSEKSI